MSSPPPTAPASVFIGGVDVSAACLEALCRLNLVPALVIGYDSSAEGIAGYVDLRPLAERYGFDLLREINVNRGDVIERIAAHDPAIIWVIGWSRLVSRSLLEIARHGCVGIHPTDLPEGRGRAPIPWTILKGLTRTASTMFFLTEGVDDGEVIGKAPITVDEREDAGTLYAKHREAHVHLIREHAQSLLAGTSGSTPQDHDRATTWPRRRPEDGLIDWTSDCREVDRLVRAVTRPFPGAFSPGPQGMVTVWHSQPHRTIGQAPGTVVRDGGAVLVACGTGSLRILEADGLEAVVDRLGYGP